MNSLLYNELKKVTAAELDFNENTTHLFIPKTIKISNKSLQQGAIYKISLSEAITNPSSSSTLAANWNAGKVPQHKEYLVEILDRMATMIKVNGIAVEDQADNFYGWVPVDSIKILEKIC